MYVVLPQIPNRDTHGSFHKTGFKSKFHQLGTSRLVLAGMVLLCHALPLGNTKPPVEAEGISWLLTPLSSRPMEQVDAHLSCAEQPITSATPTPFPATRRSSDDAGDHIDVSHLVDGLRPGTPPPTVNPRDQVGNNGHGEDILERKSDVKNSNRGREPTAPAPFHSNIWGSKATAAALHEDVEDG